MRLRYINMMLRKRELSVATRLFTRRLTPIFSVAHICWCRALTQTLRWLNCSWKVRLPPLSDWKKWEVKKKVTMQARLDTNTQCAPRQTDTDSFISLIPSIRLYLLSTSSSRSSREHSKNSTSVTPVGHLNQLQLWPWDIHQSLRQKELQGRHGLVAWRRAVLALSHINMIIAQ